MPFPPRIPFKPATPWSILNGKIQELQQRNVDPLRQRLRKNLDPFRIHGLAVQRDFSRFFKAQQQNDALKYYILLFGIFSESIGHAYTYDYETLMFYAKNYTVILLHAMAFSSSLFFIRTEPQLEFFLKRFLPIYTCFLIGLLYCYGSEADRHLPKRKIECHDYLSEIYYLLTLYLLFKADRLQEFTKPVLFLYGCLSVGLLQYYHSDAISRVQGSASSAHKAHK